MAVSVHRANLDRSTHQLLISAIIRHYDIGNHREVLTVEGYEAQTEIVGGGGDQGVR